MAAFKHNAGRVRFSVDNQRLVKEEAEDNLSDIHIIVRIYNKKQSYFAFYKAIKDKKSHVLFWMKNGP